MKGKKVSDTKVTRAYAGGDSNVAREAHSDTDGFKRGGKAKAGKKVMGEAAKVTGGRKPRKSGGGVFSSAASGTPRPGFKA